MTEQQHEVELKGYTTDVTMATAILAQPCAEHHEPGWQERAVRALSEGWPVDGYSGGPYDPDCPACQAMPTVRYEAVLGHETNDPRCVGVDPETGAAILIHNPIKRWWHKATSRGRRPAWRQA